MTEAAKAPNQASKSVLTRSDRHVEAMFGESDVA